MITKVISGKQSNTHIQNYLESNDRAKYRFSNYSLEGWGEKFDLFHRTSALRASRNPRMYDHIIISPDPRMNVDPKDLSDIVDETLHEYTYRDDFNVAYYGCVHVDTGVPHVHVVIANADLSNMGANKFFRGKYPEQRIANLRWDIGEKLRAMGYMYAHTDQDIALQLGAKKAQALGIDTAQLDKQRQVCSYKNLSREEKDMLAHKRYPKKEIIRQLIDLAIETSTTEKEFFETIYRWGLDTERSSSGKRRFCLTLDKDLMIEERSLGEGYTSHAIKERIAQNASRLNGDPQYSYQMDVQRKTTDKYLMEVHQTSILKSGETLEDLHKTLVELKQKRIDFYPDFIKELAKKYDQKEALEAQGKDTSELVQEIEKMLILDTKIKKYHMFGDVENIYTNFKSVEDVRRAQKHHEKTLTTGTKGSQKKRGIGTSSDRSKTTKTKSQGVRSQEHTRKRERNDIER